MKVAILPLSKKEELMKKSNEIWDMIRPHFRVNTMKRNPSAADTAVRMKSEHRIV